ncbi:hypothetical protein JMJ35_003258 [Cladonia borealis]|uniref:Conserved oligomeric Golgi complex subunit 8 n=1 Tax=Cladonia borealis TaxID=184061 RepID=A0AA39R722_9LECA|nr:hypothetical protein JMJ35_003258 [Cladonia borealis]
MADPLYELLSPYFDNSTSPRPVPSVHDNVTAKYLNRLSTLPLASLTSTEPQSLAQSSHSNLLSIQSLSARSNSALVASSDHLSSLRTTLPQLASHAQSLRHDIPKLDSQAVSFSENYSRSTENEVLDRRKKALLMARNVDRISDILDLPTLLSSTISSATAQGAANTTSYASALDLHSHIKRLHLLYQDSPLISSIYHQTETAMQDMTASLILSLRSQNIKLASAMRTIGWLRRVAPELDGSPTTNKEGYLGALFLVCRLATLISMLSALEPLRDLADQETAIRLRDGTSNTNTKDAWSVGQQTERYLKRYIEIFREQSFAIVSTYKSIFPSSSETSSAAEDLGLMKFKSIHLKTTPTPHPIPPQDQAQDPLFPLPSALATFPLHLVSLLTETLKQYLPNVRDKSSRESLLTQVLYCAGSLGRLGGDFSFLLAELGDDGEGSDEEGEGDGGEWVEVMRKHRVLAGKLESLASGAGGGRGMAMKVGGDTAARVKSPVSEVK